MITDFTYSDGKLFRKGREVGSMDNHGYLRTTVNYRKYLVHRLIYKLHNPEFDLGSDLVIDHINRNRTDNRIENLRSVTKAENNRNRDLPIGVSYCKQTGKWKAIQPRWLGRFDTEQEAIDAVNAARA